MNWGAIRDRQVQRAICEVVAMEALLLMVVGVLLVRYGLPLGVPAAVALGASYVHILRETARRLSDN